MHNIHPLISGFSARSLINRTMLVKSAVITLLAILLSPGPACYADDDETPAAKPEKAASADLRQLAGIKTQTLQAASQAPEIAAFGSVVNLEPLLTFRQQLLQERAMQSSAQARYRESDANLARTRDLHNHDIVSTRRLQEQQAQWQSDQANLAATGYRQQNLLSASRLQWGDTLTAWFAEPDGKLIAPFLAQRRQLLIVSLPPNSSLPDNTQDIAVAQHGDRTQAITAQLIGPAPQADPLTQGRQYFFITEQQNLPYGARVTVWIKRGIQASQGVWIPESAVVWHLGQAFVFVQSAANQFVRRLLPSLTLGANGYFAGEPFSPGEEIVVQGAQTLLSQELKNLIPDEDND